jgi:hypothetical protein
MARKKKSYIVEGFTQPQYDAWVEQGRPEGTFEYRGKKIESPIPGLYGLLERKGGQDLYRPDQLEKMKEKIEATQDKIASELKKLKAEALKLWEKDSSHARELGEVLVKIRDKSATRGDFKDWWTEAGFTQSRVSYCLRVAEDKIVPAKRKTKESPRFVVLSSIGKKLSDLYSAIEKDDSAETIEKLVEEIVKDVQGLRLTVVPKEKAPKKKARAAGAGK